MDNFFDMVADSELETMFGFVFSEIAKDNMRENFKSDADQNYYFLTKLYVLRGNDIKAQESLNMIKNDILRLDAGMSWQEIKR